MKNSLTLLFTTAALAIAAISCKPEAKPEPVPGPEPDKKVPVEQSFNVKAGDVVNVEFESYAAWSASSDAEWISFTPAKGEAGAGTIACTIGAQKPSFTDASKGTLAITVEGKAYNMTFLREASVRATRFTDANGNPIDKLVFDANADGGLSVQITVEANYYWDLDRTSSPWPSWITNPGRTDGKLDEDGIYRKTFTLTINEAEVGDTDKSAEITFIDLDDETYKKVLAVEYKAKVIPDDPFAIICDLGQEVHITPEGFYKDKDGNVIPGKFSLDYSIDVEDPSQYVTLTCNGIKYDNNGHSSFHDNNNPFVNVYPSMTEPENPKAFMALAMPGIISSEIYDMGYIFILPEKIWKPYEQWVGNKMMFAMMLMSGVFFNDLKDENGDQVYDKHNNFVKELKPELEKYTIRVYIDKE